MQAMSKRERFRIFIGELRAAPAVGSREDGLALLKSTMRQVEDDYSGKPYGDCDTRMTVFGWEFNWKDLDTDPCWWQDAFNGAHITQIYHSGRIVITNIKVSPNVLVLDKPGI